MVDSILLCTPCVGRERLRQQRINRLASAVEALEEDAGLDTESLAGHFRKALLSPQDEQLVEKLLAQVVFLALYNAGLDFCSWGLFCMMFAKHYYLQQASLTRRHHNAHLPI